MALGLPSEEREVGDFTFTFTKLTATEARKVQLILMRALGPGVAALGQGSLSEGALGDALSKAMKSLKDEDVDQLVKLLAGSSRVSFDGGNKLVRDVYDLFFAGKMLLHWKWIGAALAYNFSDFLGEAGNLGDLLGMVKGSQ